jgi:hypothetical protein
VIRSGTTKETTCYTVNYNLFLKTWTGSISQGSEASLQIKLCEEIRRKSESVRHLKLRFSLQQNVVGSPAKRAAGTSY